MEELWCSVGSTTFVLRVVERGNWEEFMGLVDENFGQIV